MLSHSSPTRTVDFDLSQRDAGNIGQTAVMFTLVCFLSRVRLKPLRSDHHHHQVPSSWRRLAVMTLHCSRSCANLTRCLYRIPVQYFVSHSRPFCDVCHQLRSWPSSAYFPLQWTLQYQPVDVVTSDQVTKVVLFLFFIVEIMWSCSSTISRTSSFVFFYLQDIFIIFRYDHISNDSNCFMFLVVIFHVSQPHKSVDHT